MTESEWLQCNAPQTLLDYHSGLPIMPASGTLLRQRLYRLVACAFCRLVWPLLYWPEVREAVEVAERVADDHQDARELLQRYRRQVAGVMADLHLQGTHWNRARMAEVACWDILPAELPWREPNLLPSSLQVYLLRDVLGNPWSRPDPVSGYYCKAHGERLDGARCEGCRGAPPLGQIEKRSPWATPVVRSLARGAYDQRIRDCPTCAGKGRHRERACLACRGSGLVDNGTLDPARLGVLADALLDAGYLSPSLEIERLQQLLAGCRWCRDGRARCEDCVDRQQQLVWLGGQEDLVAHLLSPGQHFRGCWAVDVVMGVR